MTERPQLPRMIIAVFALIGLLDAGYLALERVISGGQIACPTGGGCTIVQNSAYSVIAGVPVAVIGVAGYATLLGLALLALQRDEIGGAPLPGALLALASIGVLFSLYLSYLQVAVIGAICFWCVVSALLEAGIGLCALLDWRAYRREAALDTLPDAAQA